MDKVLAQLDEHFIRLMRNWARATAGSSAAYSMSSAYDGVPSGDGYDTVMPVLQGEAIDVDVAFQAVPLTERKAVQIYWLFEGKSYKWLAGRLACTDKTVIQRCITGHVWLKVELMRRRRLAGQIGRLNGKII